MVLHLMMGIVNHLLKFLKETRPDVSKWLAEIKVVGQPYHGGQLSRMSENSKKTRFSSTIF